MSYIVKAFKALGVDDIIVYEDPQTEEEFNAQCQKITGKTIDGSAILSSDPDVFGKTWKEVKAKADELKTAEDALAYQHTRSLLYPDIGDQLDDLYKKGAFSDDMAAKIKKVKDDVPKIPVEEE